jgi:hypothetical protein
MDHLTYETVRRSPELLAQLLEDARRERSEAVHELVSSALRAFFSRRRPTAALALRPTACG